MKILAPMFLALAWTSALADTVVANRTIRPQTILSAHDLAVQPMVTSGSFTNPAKLIGQEARVALYAGQPIRFDAVGPPALIKRNQIITLRFSNSGLLIATDGRSLARAGVGEIVRVMNLSSRTTVTGLVASDGSVLVSN